MFNVLPPVAYTFKHSAWGKDSLDSAFSRNERRQSNSEATRIRGRLSFSIFSSVRC